MNYLRIRNLLTKFTICTYIDLETIICDIESLISPEY